MKKYRKKPVVIEAQLFDGSEQSGDSIVQWADRNNAVVHNSFHPEVQKYYLKIHTLEGVMEATAGDYIIKGVKGEFYPCKPDIFKATYEEVQSEHRGLGSRFGDTDYG